MRRTRSTAPGTSSGAAAAPAAAYPRVELVYQYLPFDRTCEQWLNTRIEESWMREIEAKLASFQEFWDKKAPSLLETTVSQIGKPFRRREMVAALTLCPVSSMSTPLLINVRRFLDGPTQGKPQPMHLFSALVFHELLHTYIPYPLPGSRLMEKYKDEATMVLTHLHLMAVMKYVYLKLRRREQLQEIIAWDSAAENPIYRRGWQIVNDIEGHRVFVDELKAFSRAPAK